MKETYLFDICGVIWDAKGLRQELVREVSIVKQKDPQEVFSDYVKFYKDFEVGSKIPQDYNYIPFEKLNEILDRLYQKENFTKFINPQVVEIINSLRNSGHQVYCLSNLENFFGKYFKENINQYFDKSYYSFEIHARKPDLEAFNFVLKDINKLAQDVTFIDDKPINVDAANKFGLKGILFSNASDLKQKLSI